MTTLGREELKLFVQSLPKTETHLHIEGACPFPLLQKLDPERFATPPPFWADDFRYDSFAQFMEEYINYCGLFFTSPERYHEAAKIVLNTCAAQNCKYVETSFHLPAIVYAGGHARDVVDAIHDACPAGMELRVFAGISHDDYHGEVKKQVDEAHQWERLAGMDLHGPEDIPVEPWSAVIWKRFRDAGKFNKSHAGEFMGADFVDYILDTLEVSRIEHGVRAVENPATVQRLVEQNIALDVCPISNLKLQVAGVPTLSQHPIRELFDQGVTVTINSDDPFFFGNTLSDEYYALHEELGFTLSELSTIARHGFDIALCDASWKAPFIQELDRISQKHSS